MNEHIAVITVLTTAAAIFAAGVALGLKIGREERK